MQYQNKTKLIKLLNLTTSTFDGEALNAVKKANESLNSSGATWEGVINGAQTNRSENYAVRKTKQLSELRNRNDLLFAENELLKQKLTELNNLFVAEYELLQQKNAALLKQVEIMEWSQKQIFDPSVKHMLELARRIRKLEGCGGKNERT